jgi:hypothetical protein
MDLFETSWAVHISSLDLRKKSATFSYSTYLFIKCQQRAYDSYERPADIFKPSWDQTDQSNSNTSFPSSTDRAKLSGKVYNWSFTFVFLLLLEALRETWIPPVEWNDHASATKTQQVLNTEKAQATECWLWANMASCNWPYLSKRIISIHLACVYGERGREGGKGIGGTGFELRAHTCKKGAPML